MRRRAFPVALLCLLAALAAGQDISPEMQQKIMGWANLQRNWGVRGSSEGARLTAKEVERFGACGRPWVAYDFYVQGLPRDQHYELYSLPITAKSPDQVVVQPPTDLQIEADGRLVDSPDDPRRIFFADPAPGEPLRLLLLSKDHNYKAFVSVVPNPIEGRDHGCNVRIIRLTPRFELTYIEGSGFAPGSEVGFSGDSSGEVHGGKLKADAAGNVQTAILPFVKDKSKGTTEISLTSETCKPHVKFQWGTIP